MKPCLRLLTNKSLIRGGIRFLFQKNFELKIYLHNTLTADGPGANLLKDVTSNSEAGRFCDDFIMHGTFGTFIVTCKERTLITEFLPFRNRVDKNQGVENTWIEYQARGR